MGSSSSGGERAGVGAAGAAAGAAAASSSSVRQVGERRRVESVCPGTESLSERPAQLALLARPRACFAQAARDLAAYAARLTRTVRVSRTAPTRARSWS
jgi:hypothetical protein